MKSHTEEREVVDIVNNFFLYQLSQNGFKWQCPRLRPVTSVDYSLRAIGDDFKSHYRDHFSEMCKRLDIKQSTLHSIFMGVANELFSEGIKWARIVALFVFSSELAYHCTNENLPHLVEEVAQAVTSYTVSNLLAWINDHGGWDSNEFKTSSPFLNDSGSECEEQVNDEYKRSSPFLDDSGSECEIQEPNTHVANEKGPANESERHILILATNVLPANTNWKGDYEFDVWFKEKEVNTKSIKNWTYSKMKDKLFVSIGASCPIFIHTTELPPGEYVIRTMAVFSEPEHQMKVVKRCLIHSNPNDPGNHGHPAPEHLIRCEHAAEVQYETDLLTGRHSVVVPYSFQGIGDEIMYIYRFMCLGSCVGGINRRPIQIIFTLEKNGDVLGRRVMEVKICACPGRDKRREEYLFQTKGTVLSKHNVETILPDLPSKKPKLSTEVDVDIDDFDSRDDDDDDDDENKIFTLKVYGRETYDLLMKIYNALEISSLITPELADILKKIKREN